MRLRKRYIIDDVPDHVWNVLRPQEQAMFFAVEDCINGRFSAQEMRERLDEGEKLRQDMAYLDRRLKGGLR